MSTSRLKRQIQGAAEDDDLSSRNLNESFCRFGTALPSLAELKKDKGEFLPLWQQEVRDERGRRRLHGAFTGGFSAGYYNTVGSKEGWTPATFESSRSKKAAGKQRTAEDFMDEEDLADLHANKSISTAKQFDISAPTASTSSQKFDSLLQINPERIGDKMMRRMGWREGQGIGPRISAAKRRQMARELGGPEEDGEEDTEAAKHTFPPLDRPLLVYPAKDNDWGLGYIPGASLLNKGKGRQTEEPKQTGPIGGAWGLGAMEEADDDDMDLYGTSTRGHNLTVAFDDEDDGTKHLLNHAPKGAFATKKKKANGKAPQFFNDGTPMLDGFALSDELQQPDKKFPGPRVPAGWQPNPKAMWERIKNPLAPRTHQAALSADDRGTMLGEKIAPRSVFDYLSSKDKDRISSLLAGPNNSKINIPEIDVETAKRALQGFIPYSDDPAKQLRYRAFLRCRAKSEDTLDKPSHMSIEDFNSELATFAQSATIFKPMSSMMASRFTSSSTPLDADLKKPTPGLRTVSFTSTSTLPSAPAPIVPAAKPALEFGFDTRTTFPFYPERLLCKRFNVPDPHPEGPINAGPDKEVLNQSTMEEIMRSSNIVPPPQAAPVQEPDDKELDYVKPSMDIFKAIFANSDDEDEDEEEDEPVIPTPTIEHPSKPDEDIFKPPAEVAMDTYEPADTSTVAVPEDLSNFKPTFISKSEKPVDSKKKRKKQKSTIVSFDVEDGETLAVPVREKKKRKKEKEVVEEEWVEKEVVPTAFKVVKPGRAKAYDLF